MSASNLSYVVGVDNRYFYKFGKKERVLTAWCLTGAKLFQTYDEAAKIFYILDSSDKTAFIIPIGHVLFSDAPLLQENEREPASAGEARFL